MAESKFQCIVDIPDGCPWTLNNLPFGVFKHEKNSNEPHIATAIGEYALDLNLLVDRFGDKFNFNTECFKKPVLNDFMELGRDCWKQARNVLLELTGDEKSPLSECKSELMFKLSECTMVLPAQIGDYTDFYSSIWHATNVGRIFRSEEEALKPNWLHLPVGYHGRASSVVVSDTDIRRPMGQLKIGDNPPSWGACRLLDFEVEMGFFYGGPSNGIGNRISIDKAYDNIFGVVLMNDWSARDIQKWEYVPLGPFNGKNFATTISPWIVTLEALEPFKTAIIPQNMKGKVPLPYLQSDSLTSYDINLSVSLTPKGGVEELLGQTNSNNLYWTFTQQLTHHTSTGCPFKPGDLCGTGTISGKKKGEFGSMLELCSYDEEMNKKAFGYPYTLKDGTTRKCIGDNDTITMRGWCTSADGLSLGFGECTGLVLPAKAD